jgi:small subunit ribosomal protein S13
MARIAGIDLPNKPLEIALTYIYGIGRTSAKKICDKSKVDPRVRANNLTQDDINELRQVIENDYIIEGRLRTEVSMNIKRLLDIGCYRGKKAPIGSSLSRATDKNQRQNSEG